MSDYDDFLLEIGCEELPPRAQAVLINALANGFESGLAECGLAHGAIHAYVTPRRLAVWIEQLQKQTPKQKVERKGPLLSLAIDAQGKPTPAGLGFAKSCGVEFASLERLASDKGECLYYTSEKPGQMTAELLPALCDKIIAALPIPKPMRWGDSDISFARPVHWIVLLFGKEVIPAKILGQKSNRLTYGHRFHHPQAIALDEPKQYEETLQKAYVIADAKKRQKKIVQGLNEVVASVKGEVSIHEELLNEVTAIVEWPVVFLGQFDKHFLHVPHEALILAMQQHQKAFYVQDKEKKLLPYFVGVSNIQSGDPLEVVRGNERVVNARLADAKFFFDSDRKHSLAFMAKRLNEIIFYARLGTLEDKTKRIAVLAQAIAKDLNLNEENAYRAGELCKADLVSDMVGEFPELQGIMGSYYAAHSHEASEVAKAIAEHYQPRFAQDELPQSPLGAVVAIADKLDTLVGIFAVGEIPKGDKDPYALRRLALGVLKIIIDRQWPLDLGQLLQKASELYGDKAKAGVMQSVFDFMMERFKYHYIEQGIAAEIFMAVLAKRPLQPYDFALRLRAVQAFCELPQSQALAAANKRVSRILEKEASALEGQKVHEPLLLEPAEKALWQSLVAKKQEVLPLYQEQKYEQALLKLASLQPIIDSFFESTMVMAEDKALRNNRLALLVELRELFSAVADLSCL
ncbi:MAG: glyS [Gammaproteobacteria bacterium]|nr:glyS [Gammaproteobacteria bacterium]